MYTDVKISLVSNYYLFIFHNSIDHNITKSSKNNIQNWFPKTTSEMKWRSPQTLSQHFPGLQQNRAGTIHQKDHQWKWQGLKTQHEGTVTIKKWIIRFTKFFTLTKASDKPRNIYLIKKAAAYSLANYHTKEPDIPLSRKPPNKN